MTHLLFMELISLGYICEGHPMALNLKWSCWSGSGVAKCNYSNRKFARPRPLFCSQWVCSPVILQLDHRRDTAWTSFNDYSLHLYTIMYSDSWRNNVPNSFFLSSDCSWSFLCARQWAKYFPYIISFNPHTNTVDCATDKILRTDVNKIVQSHRSVYWWF